jgi:hypothetical protein
MAKYDCLSLAVGKVLQGVVHETPGIRGVQTTIRRRAWVDLDWGVGNRRNPAPQPIVTKIQRYPVQPSIEFGLAGSPMGRNAPCPDQSFLGHILGLVDVPQQSSGKGQHTRRLPRKEEFERTLVAATGAP